MKWGRVGGDGGCERNYYYGGKGVEVWCERGRGLGDVK